MCRGVASEAAFTVLGYKMMTSSYLALARQWRPQSLSQLVGQPYVVRALTNALSTGRLHHAYLFSGTRGVGKTSIARILAKSLNCQTGITPEPCRQCESCLAIEQGCFPDLIEVDAASNTKVEDTRTLLENVPYAPTMGRYKVYLIDEVHMLSNHSFNVLLKTLEEPPPHVIFILATTEPERLPMTILSRCLQFQLQNMTVQDIEQHLAVILNHENIPFEATSLEPIALSAKGSMRDALSLLERAIVIGEGHLNAQTVQQWLGAASFDQAVELVTLLANQQSKALIEQAAVIFSSGTLANQLFDRLLQVLHEISLLQAVPDLIGVRSRETLSALALKLSPEMVQLFYQIILIGKRDLASAPSPEIGLTMTLMRLLAFYPADNNEPPRRPKPNVVVAAVPEARPCIAPAPTQAPVKERSVEGVDAWGKILSELPIAGLLKILAESCLCESWEGNTIRLLLDIEQKPIFNETRQKALQQILTEHYGAPINLSIKLGEVKDRTPMKQAQIRQQNLDSELKVRVEADPFIQSAVQQMNASIEKIAPVEK